MDENIVRAYLEMANENLEIIDDPDIIPYLHEADVMLTDTSSVVSEFLLLKKPVVTFKTKSPADHVIDFRNAAELEPSLKHALTHPSEVMSAADAFVKRMHPYADGRSSERVLAATDRFIDRYRGKLKAKPLNIWRKLKVRSRMKYYRLR
jgi:CDP-glycerol glycerophosphotransferase (TagB/SpsB family)